MSLNSRLESDQEETKNTAPNQEERWGATRGLLHEIEISIKLSGNEVYYTISSTLLVKDKLCSKLHRDSLNLIPFSCKL